MSTGEIKKSSKITHPYAYTEDNRSIALTARDEDIRIKKNNITKPRYFSYSTGEELDLIHSFKKKKHNKSTGEPIEVRAYFKRKDRVAKGQVYINNCTEDGYKVSTNESQLHNLAKECFRSNALFKMKGISVKNKLYDYNNDLTEYYKLLDECIVVIDSVEMEYTLKLKDENGEDIRRKPDIKIRCYCLEFDCYFDLYVEIAVKHKKSQEDIKIFKHNKLNVIEINLEDLIDMSNNIGDADDNISPNKFLSILNINVLHNINRQTWISNELLIDYLDNQSKINVYNIEKCNYRDMGQEGMLNFKCNNSIGGGSRTITNLDCARCKNCVGTLGDIEYIRDTNKVKCNGLPYLICCTKPDIIDTNTLDIIFKHGYNNLSIREE